jgi:anti-sigma regulatory factor (Ser/Thr protein kinase)
VIRHGRFSLERIADAAAAAPMRRALSDFLDAVGIPESIRLDVITAVGEALANAIEHAYCGGPAGEVRIVAFVDGDDALNVQVVDRGTFIKPRSRPQRGFGLRIVHAVADSVELETTPGTTLRMRFRLNSAR